MTKHRHMAVSLTTSDANHGGGCLFPSIASVIPCIHPPHVCSVGQLRLALNYTNKALRLEINYQENGANPAGTHLNMCAILSQLGR